MHRSLSYVVDPQQREAIYDAQAAAKTKFEEFVLREPKAPNADPVTEAAESVLREARVPR
jgi:hypothetical protein